MIEPSLTGFFVSVLPILLHWIKRKKHGKFTCKRLYHLPLFYEVDPKKKNTKNKLKQNLMLVANGEKIECLGWSDKHKMTWDELQSV